jgi:hypothetical protein
MQAAVMVAGTQRHVLTGVPMQASVFAQGVQRIGSPQPLLASTGTHLSPHFLVLAPQVPTMQVEP